MFLRTVNNFVASILVIFLYFTVNIRNGGADIIKRLNISFAEPVDTNRAKLYKVIYNILNKNLTEKTMNVHDNYRYKPINYALKGVADKNMIFHSASLVFSSLDDEFVNVIENEALKHGINFDSQHAEPVFITDEAFPIVNGKKVEITGRCISPITVSRTKKGKKRNILYNEEPDTFIEYLNANTTRKYEYLTGQKLDRSIDHFWLAEDYKKNGLRKTLMFNGSILGHMAPFKLTAPTGVAEMLFYTGTGERNALGFGCFEIEELEVLS